MPCSSRTPTMPAHAARQSVPFFFLRRRRIRCREPCQRLCQPAPQHLVLRALGFTTQRDWPLVFRRIPTQRASLARPSSARSPACSRIRAKLPLLLLPSRNGKPSGMGSLQEWEAFRNTMLPLLLLLSSARYPACLQIHVKFLLLLLPSNARSDTYMYPLASATPHNMCRPTWVWAPLPKKGKKWPKTRHCHARRERPKTRPQEVFRR